MARIRRRTIQKIFHNPDNHNGVITHLEPDILECEVKRALGSITMNKASGCDRIPAELFQILKDDAEKYCTHYASKFGKLIRGHRTGKGQFSFQPQRKAMPKNVQVTVELTHFTCPQDTVYTHTHTIYKYTHTHTHTVEHYSA